MRDHVVSVAVDDGVVMNEVMAHDWPKGCIYVHLSVSLRMFPIRVCCSCALHFTGPAASPNSTSIAESAP